MTRMVNIHIRMTNQVKRARKHGSRKIVYFTSMVLIASISLVIFFIISLLRINSNISTRHNEEMEKTVHLFKPVMKENDNFTNTSVAINDTVQLNVAVTSKIVKKVDEEDRTLRLFNPVITRKERDDFRKALMSFHDAVKWNITYFMYGGTLLGSYRHHGMIPWDDDLDLLVNENDKNILKECLATLDSEFELNIKMKHSWKFSHKNSFLTKRGWKWPFLDIFFYREDGTYLWDIKPGIKRVRYEKRNVFPLIERPFMGMLLPAPRNTKVMLSQLFDLNKCQSNSYNHKNEDSVAWKYVVNISCDLLRNKFHFVRRVYTSNGSTETLDTVNNGTLSENNTTYILRN